MSESQPASPSVVSSSDNLGSRSFASARGLFVLSTPSVRPSVHSIRPPSVCRWFVLQHPASLLLPSLVPAAWRPCPSDLKHDPRRRQRHHSAAPLAPPPLSSFSCLPLSPPRSSRAPHINIGRLFSEYRGELPLPRHKEPIIGPPLLGRRLVEEGREGTALMWGSPQALSMFFSLSAAPLLHTKFGEIIRHFR